MSPRTKNDGLQRPQAVKGKRMMNEKQIKHLRGIVADYEGQGSHFEFNKLDAIAVREAADLIESQQTEIEALKDSNKHLAALLAPVGTPVREVFEEISNIFLIYGQLSSFINEPCTTHKDVLRRIAALKKKYVKE